MFEIIRDPSSNLYGTVLFGHQVHPALSASVATLREAYMPSTWKDRLREAEHVLNMFFTPIPGTSIPILFVDKGAGRLLIKQRCEQKGAKCTRRQPAGFGYRLVHSERSGAVRLDTQLHLGRSLLDIAVENGDAFTGNAFVRDGYDAEEQRRANAIQRSKAPEDAEFKPMDTGRYFSVHVPSHQPPVIGDPHLHGRIDRALQRYCPNPGVYRGWQTVHDLWCRGDEGFSMTMRSLFLGATALGEKRFGRLVFIKDKPTGPDLVKMAAFSQSYSKVFYEDYFDGERRLQDPSGWGVKEYEEACWAGDEAALDTPVFYTLTGTGLRADTARYLFGKVIRKARITCGDRYAWIHLTRHDRVETALEDIHAMDVSEDVKQELRERMAEYIAWAGGTRLLKVYGRRFEALKAATDAVRFQDDHDPANRRRTTVMSKGDDDLFDEVFGN